DTEAGEWVELTGAVVDPVNHTISAPVSHFTNFAMLAKITEEEPIVEPTPIIAPEPTPVSEAEDDDVPTIALISGFIVVMLTASVVAFTFLLRKRKKESMLQS
ncbi:hypothetical protein, partial [Neptuniibacter sp.]|uniref:hypothetical protein n=1 Tax=Neptuniibacter sp. TaxID=1962643 RepID=UPI002619972E